MGNALVSTETDRFKQEPETLVTGYFVYLEVFVPREDKEHVDLIKP